MEDTLTVSRVKIQAIDADGYPQGMPWFAVLARGPIEESLSIDYGSRDDLEAAISESPSLVDIADPEDRRFAGLDREAIGHANYSGDYPRKAH